MQTGELLGPHVVGEPALAPGLAVEEREEVPQPLVRRADADHTVTCSREKVDGIHEEQRGTSGKNDPLWCLLECHGAAQRVRDRVGRGMHDAGAKEQRQQGRKNSSHR